MRGLYTCTQLCLLWYIPLGVMRNLAYYRHIPGKNLPDLAYDLISENDNTSMKHKMEACFWTVVLSLLVLTVVGNVIYQPPQMPRVYVINAVFKSVCCLQGGMILRSLVFCSTSIPGAASHCHPELDPMYWTRKPKSVSECFNHVNLTEPNCGDLLFSGHVFTNLFVVTFLFNYTRSIFGWHPRLHKLLFVFLYIGVLLYCYSILEVRNHYLVDVVMSFIFTPMYIHAFNKFWHFDVDPRQVDPSGESESRLSKLPTICRVIINYLSSCYRLHIVISVAEIMFIWLALNVWE